MNAVVLLPSVAAATPLLAGAALWAFLTRRPLRAPSGRDPVGARPGTRPDGPDGRRHDGAGGPPRDVVARVGDRVVRLLGRRWSDRTARRLRAAEAAPVPVPRHAGRLAVAAGAGAVVAGTVGAALPLGGIAGVTAPLVGVAVAVAAIDGSVDRRARRRRDTLDRQVAALVDTLVALLRAGAPLRRALLQVASSLRGPIAEELLDVERDLAVGLDLHAALDRFATRTGAPAAGQLVATIRRSERLGTPLGDVLDRLARDRRTTAAHRARRHAARAEPRLSAVVVLTFVPATLVVVLAGLLLGTDGLSAIVG